MSLNGVATFLGLLCVVLAVFAWVLSLCGILPAAVAGWLWLGALVGTAPGVIYIEGGRVLGWVSDWMKAGRPPAPPVNKGPPSAVRLRVEARLYASQAAKADAAGHVEAARLNRHREAEAESRLAALPPEPLRPPGEAHGSLELSLRVGLSRALILLNRIRG